jgi:ABC-type uncharacterized transport system substrate-binding protein
MIRKSIFVVTIGVILLVVTGLFSQAATSGSCKVLVVMSYDAGYEWVVEIREGIESVLGGSCNITYFYMDTKRDLEGGLQKAEEAYALYRELQPDGVIAADDNAQSMFVVPYLKDKVKTPVMFCGVNYAPEKYGYPASNVSGVLERFHISQSLALAAQLVPSIKTVAYFMYDSPTGGAILEEFKSKEHTFPLESVAVRTPKTLKETVAMASELQQQCDVLFTPSMQGIMDGDGSSMTDKEVIPILAKTFGKPVIGGSSINIKYGILCGVVVSGQEQGATAARMLLKAIEGTHVSEILITTNRKGRAMVNVTVMKAFGIKPKPILLKGAEIVETVE